MVYPIIDKVLTCFNHPRWCKISSIHSMIKRNRKKAACRPCCCGKPSSHQPSSSHRHFDGWVKKPSPVVGLWQPGLLTFVSFFVFPGGCFGTWLLYAFMTFPYFPIILGMSSSQLTNSLHHFSEGWLKHQPGY